MKMIPSQILLLTFLFVFPLRAQNPPQASGSSPKPVQMDEVFLTTAVEGDVMVKNRKEKGWLPGDTNLAFPWSDRPFAIHVPFHMETEVRQLTEYAVARPGDRRTPVVYAKDYGARVYFRGFVYTNGTTITEAQPKLLTACLYRMDGEPLYNDQTNRFYFLDPIYLRNLDARPDNKIYPFEFSGRPARAPGRVALCLVVDPRDAISQYAWEKFGERASGRLMASIIEFDRKVEQKQWTPEKEFQISVHQNGWILREPQVSTSGNWDQVFLDKPNNDEWRFQDLGTTVQGLTITSKHRLIAGTPYQSEKEKADRKPMDVEVQIQMPPRVFDHLWATNGNLAVRQTLRGSYPYRARYGLEPHRAAVSFTAFQYPGETNGQPRTVAGWGYAQGVTDFATGKEWDQATELYRLSERMNLYPAMIHGFSPREKNQNLLASDWPPEKGIDKHRIYAADINFYTDGKTNLVPRKHIDFYAVRISDVEDNRVGRTGIDAPVAETDPLDDGYWEWRAEFTALANKVQTRISTIHGKLRTLDKIKGKVNQRFLLLLELDQSAFPKDPEERGDLVGWWISTKRVDFGLSRGAPPKPTLSKETLALLRAQRNGLLETNNMLHARQKELLEESAQLLKSQVTSATIQAGKSSEARRKEMWDTVEITKDLGAIERLRLYESAGWLDSEEARQALNELNFPDKSVKDIALLFSAKAAYARARSEEHKLWLQRISPKPPQPNSAVEINARTARANAMRDAGESVRLNPANPEARALLKTLELDFLSIIAAKLDQTRKISLAAMHHYLEARGFYTKDNTTMWEGIKEAGSVFFFSFPSVVGLGLADVPGELAESVDIEQTNLAQHEVSLMAIQKLRNNGLPLAEIAQATPRTINLWLTLKRQDGRLLPDDQADRICRDIRETFAALPDLKALLDGTPQQINELLQRNYYDALNPSVPGLEIFANIFFSPTTLLCMSGPGAIVRGAQGYHFTLSGVTGAGFEMNLLAQGAKAERASEFLFRGLKVAELGEGIAAKYPGLMTYLVNPLRVAVQADAELIAAVTTAVEGAGTLAQVGAGVTALGNFGARFAATMVIAGGISSLAEEHHLGALRVLVDCIVILGAERIGYELLEKSGVPLAKLAKQVEEFAGFVASKEIYLKEVSSSLKALEVIQERVSAAAGVSRGLLDQEIKTLARVNAQVKRGTTLVAGANPEAEIGEAIAAAAKALQAGNPKEAKRALAAAQSIHTDCVQVVVQSKVAAGQAQKVIAAAQAAPVPRAPRMPIAGLKPVFEEEVGDLAIKYASDALGAALKEGDDLLRALEFGKAKQVYQRAMDLAFAEGKGVEALKFRKRLQLLELALAEAENIKAAGSDAANLALKEAAAELSEAEAIDVIAKIKAGAYQIEFKGDSANLVFLIKEGDKPLYIFKHFTPQPGMTLDQIDKLGEAAIAECVAPAVLNALKPISPASRRMEKLGVELQYTRKVKDAAGIEIDRLVTEEGSGVLMRFVQNDGELWKMKEPVLLALKKDYAFQRVFRAWIGDTDGHLRNFMRVGKGRTAAIDFDYAQCTKKMLLRQGGIDCATQEEMMLQAVFMPQMFHAVTKRQGLAAPARIYGWVDRLDDWITYDEMADAVQGIKELCARGNGGELKNVLRKSGLKEAEINEAVEVLLERGATAGADGISPLENALRTRFDSNYSKFDPKRGLNRVSARVTPHWQSPLDFGPRIAVASSLSDADFEFAPHASFDLAAEIPAFKEPGGILAFAE